MFRKRRQTKVALAGAGFIAVVHSLAVKEAGAKLSAVASLGGTSARHLAGQFDARRVSADALPAGADILVVATPPTAHARLALQGSEAGALVLVEKPLATTLAEADLLVDAADRGSLLFCCENLLHAPAWVEATRLRDRLGPLTHLSMTTLQPSPTWGHFKEPLDIGGALFDLGPHAVALALGVAGEVPTSVSCELSSRRDDGADDHATLAITFASGLSASLEVGWDSPRTTWELQASSDTGVVRLELLPEVILEHNGDPVAVPTTTLGGDPALEQFGYLDQMKVAIALVGSTEPATAKLGCSLQTMREARDVLDVIFAAYRSARDHGSEVALPFVGDRSLTPMQLWRNGSPSR